MTPQEQELIQNIANKFKASPSKPKDADAERLIATEIGSQEDIVYKLTQAVLVQEMALKNLKAQNEFLETKVAHYKTESERGAFSRMMGGSNPPPVAPVPMQQPSAFGSFMQTAAGVAAGMVAGHLLTEALFGEEEAAPEEAAAAPAAEAEAAPETAPEAAPAEVAAAEEPAASFLADDAGFVTDFAAVDSATEEFTDFGDFGSSFDSFEQDFEEEDV